MLTKRLRNGGAESNTFGPTGLRLPPSTPGAVSPSLRRGSRLASVTDALGYLTAYEYNDRGQLTKTTYADATFTTHTYDADGNQVARTDELGHTWTMAYDDHHRRTSATNPLARTTSYVYDEFPGGAGCCGGGVSNGGTNLTHLISPLGKVTKFTYDAIWQRISTTLADATPDAATTIFTYDVAGQLTATTDPAASSGRRPTIPAAAARAARTHWATPPSGLLISPATPLPKPARTAA